MQSRGPASAWGWKIKEGLFLRTGGLTRITTGSAQKQVWLIAYTTVKRFNVYLLYCTKKSEMR